MGSPPIFYVIAYQPGEIWEAGKSFRDQPGVMEHVGYMAQLAENGHLLMGGPFLDNSGGMAVIKAGSLYDATAVAQADPSIKGSLLKATVREWIVLKSTVTSG